MLDRSIFEAAGRIEAIIGAANRVAAEIRAEALAEANRHLEEAEREADRVAMRRITEISELTDSLRARADRLLQASDEFVGALEHAMRAVAATVGAAGHAARDKNVSDRIHGPEQPKPAVSAVHAGRKHGVRRRRSDRLTAT
jgi:hypothetical protein